MPGSLQTPWLATFVLGIACGIVVLEGGVVGLVIVALGVLAILWKGPRLAGLGGLLGGFGMSWLLLIGQAVVGCVVRDLLPQESCSSGNVAPWLVFAAVVLAAGLALTAVAVRRSSS